MTGIPATGPMSPRPSTAEPSVMTATMFCRRVSWKDSGGVLLDLQAGGGHAGGVGQGEVLLGLDGVAGDDLQLALELVM